MQAVTSDQARLDSGRFQNSHTTIGQGQQQPVFFRVDQLFGFVFDAMEYFGLFADAAADQAAVLFV